MPGIAGGNARGVQGSQPSNLGSWQEAAELASEAARAEGASIPREPSRRRANGPGTAATTLRAGVAQLAMAADQAEQASPLLGVAAISSRTAALRRRLASREAARWQSRQ